MPVSPRFATAGSSVGCVSHAVFPAKRWLSTRRRLRGVFAVCISANLLRTARSHVCRSDESRLIDLFAIRRSASRVAGARELNGVYFQFIRPPLFYCTRRPLSTRSECV